MCSFPTVVSGYNFSVSHGLIHATDHPLKTYVRGTWYVHVDLSMDYWHSRLVPSQRLSSVAAGCTTGLVRWGLVCDSLTS